MINFHFRLAAVVCALPFLLIHGHCEAAASLAGKWQMAMDTPHGRVTGPLQLDQSGANLKGTYQVEHMGSFAITGTVDGKKVSLTMEVPDGSKFTLEGAVETDKMSGSTSMGGTWSATRERTAAAAKPILGTVAGFKTASREIGVKPDDGPLAWFQVGPETQVVRIPAGERDLAKATPAAIADFARGDRILVSFVDGMSEARRIVLIPSTDIARRNEAERLDWQQRGISGVVASRNGNDIVVELRTMQTVKTVTVAVTPKTKLRRYAPDSVKFTDAQPGTLAELSPGDQLRARGNREGDRVQADDLVFGTFVTRLGPVTSIDRAEGLIKIDDLVTKQPLTIRLTADSKLKKMPDVRTMAVETPSHGAAPAAPAGHDFDMAQMLEAMPAASVDDLKVGGMVIVTSTRGASNLAATAIMLIANADSLVKVAQAQSKTPGENPMDAINRMHGGNLGGPGGVTLPALIP